jgi:hypothetical protein
MKIFVSLFVLCFCTSALAFNVKYDTKVVDPVTGYVTYTGINDFGEPISSLSDPEYICEFLGHQKSHSHSGFFTSTVIRKQYSDEIQPNIGTIETIECK